MIISTRSPHRLGLLLIGAVLAAGISSVAVVSSDSPASAAACQGCIVVSAPSINLNVTARPGEQAVIDKEGGVAVYTPLTTAAIGGPGTVWLVGHRTTHGSVFNRVPSLQAGDVVNLVDDAGTHQYIVSRLLVVSASGWANQVNIYDMSHSRLILQTSHPDSNLRYLIEAFASVPEPCRTTPLAIGGSTLSTATTRFVAVPPQRLLDTRTDGAGAVCAGGNVELQIAGVAGISATATAVALTVTATGAGGPGFVAVGPLGVDPSATSSVNLSAGGQTRANLVMVAIGQAGRIVLHSSVATHLVVDVAGYYEPSATATDGRFVDVASQRLLDTRTDQVQHRLLANQAVTVSVVGEASGVPVDGASAVLVNLTALNGTPPGFVTAWATGSPQPVTSNVNLSGTGSAAANLAIVPLGADGTMQVAASADLDLIIDIVGYFTNANALDSTIGLFVPLAPRRVLDTRSTQALLSANSISSFDLLGPAGIAGPANLVTNLTSTGSLGQGFLAITEDPVPSTSNLNVSKGETRANMAVIYIRNSEQMHLYVSLPTHVIIDVTGYFTADSWLHKFGAIRLPA
ncbi:hypothetical protein BH10ACT2_BH10ACT2_22520 [soil metagenome]